MKNLHGCRAALIDVHQRLHMRTTILKANEGICRSALQREARHLPYRPGPEFKLPRLVGLQIYACSCKEIMGLNSSCWLQATDQPIVDALQSIGRDGNPFSYWNFSNRCQYSQKRSWKSSMPLIKTGTGMCLRSSLSDTFWSRLTQHLL